MAQPLIFDIETAALPLDRIKQIFPPFDLATAIGPHPPAFDESAVKIGNLKDEAKIAAKKREALDKYNKTIADYERKKATAEDDHWAAILDKAALSAITGQVIAIGYRGEKELLHLAVNGVTESHLIRRFWKQYATCRQSSRSMVGFNIEGFDVPFLAQRSWILGIDVPDTVFQPGSRFLDSTFVDLFKVWQCGNRQGKGSLDVVCKACGIGGKPEGTNGADFAGLLRSDDPEKRKQAEQYLSNDLELPARLAERFGVL